MIYDRQYILDHTIPIPFSGCWVWESTFIESYVRVGMRPNTSAHRLAYALWNNIAVEALQGEVHHKCEVKSCCNPEHLELKSASQHTIDHLATRVLITHCIHGHALTADNVVMTHNGTVRECLTCRRRYSRTAAYKRRQRRWR